MMNEEDLLKLKERISALPKSEIFTDAQRLSVIAKTVIDSHVDALKEIDLLIRKFGDRCHICGRRKDEPGQLFCSAPHPTDPLVEVLEKERGTLKKEVENLNKKINELNDELRVARRERDGLSFWADST